MRSAQRQRQRNVRLAAGGLVVGGFALALFFTLGGGAKPGGSTAVPPPPPFLAPNYGNGVSTPGAGPANAGSLHVRDGDVAIAIPLAQATIPIACGDHIDVIVNSNIIGNILVLRVTGNAAGTSGAAAAPGAAGATTATSSLIVEVPQGVAPNLLQTVLRPAGTVTIAEEPIPAGTTSSCTS